jgi:hypothetical protein
VLGSWQFIMFLVVAMLAAVFGSVAISVGLSALRPY